MSFVWFFKSQTFGYIVSQIKKVLIICLSCVYHQLLWTLQCIEIGTFLFVIDFISANSAVKTVSLMLITRVHEMCAIVFDYVID